MCDSFPAISAEQLTKAVNLAAAGTLSALSGVGEDLSEHGESRDKKTAFDNDSSKEMPALSKPLSGIPKSNICREEITPSTSFYGRARKISTKKKLSEERPATSLGKKFSSRKNYKLSPPLIPNGIRSVGAQVLLNPQVVKISHPSSNAASNIQANRINATHAIRPITLIHSPQLPQNFPKTSGESSSLLSTILKSPPRVLSPQISCDIPVQKLHVDERAQKMIVVSESSSPNQETVAVATTQIESKSKSPQLFPITKSDSVFRVPFPVSYSHAASSPTNTLQILRLTPTTLNSNNLSVSNIGSSSPVLSSLSSNQVFSQMVQNKERPKAANGATLLSQFTVLNKPSLSSNLTVHVTSTGPSQVVTSPIVSPKCITGSHSLTSTTRQGVTNSERIAPVTTKATPIISLPHPINLSSLTHQVISPVEKPNCFITPFPVKSLSSALTKNTPRYVSIRPNLLMSTAMSSMAQVRPVFIVTSSNNNVSLSTSSAKIPSNQSIVNISKSNAGLVLLPSTVNSIPVMQSTTQPQVIVTTTAPKSQSQPDIKSPAPRSELDIGNDTNTGPEGTGLSTHSVPKSSNSKQPILTSITVPSIVSSGHQTSTIIANPSCQTLTLSTSSHSHMNVTKAPAVDSVNIVQSASSAALPSFQQPVLSNSHSGATYCVSSLHHVSSSGLTSNRSKSSQPALSMLPPSPGSTNPRMPLTVVKDPFLPRLPDNKGAVRLTVYPLPPGFNLASATSTTPVSHFCPSRKATTPSSISLTSKEEKDVGGGSISLPTTLSRQDSSSNTRPPTTTIPVCNDTPSSMLSSNVRSAISTDANGKQLGESLQSINTNGRKLVISPAGITQLQSLLRKMGTKEGYFIISTPRSVPVEAQQKSMALNKQDLTGCPHTMDPSQDQFTMPILSTSNIKSNSELSDASDVRFSNVNSSPDSTVKKDSSDVDEMKAMDIVERKDDKLEENNSTEAMSDVESDIVEEGDSDDGETSTSGDSSCSSNALIIETNDSLTEASNSATPSKDLEDIDKPLPSPDKGASVSPSKQATEVVALQNKFTSVEMNANLESNITSPLSLNEIVRQHQSRYGLEYQPLYSPPFSSCKEVVMSAPESTNAGRMDKEDQIATSHSESSDVRFPVPESPLGISSLLRQHQQLENNSQQSQPDNQTIYEQSLNTPHALYSHHDQINDIHIHNSSDIEAAMNLQRLSECPGPPPSTSMSSVHHSNVNTSSHPTNVNSPKSPLSINSSHPAEPHTPLHPPMTPNTMLINLLNRVPTPLLTNHQDLLSVPSSQENEIHFQGANQSLESSVSTSKELHSDKIITSNLQESLVNSSKNASSDILYTATSHPLPDNTGSFEIAPQQNALDLIASNYLPSNRKEINSALSDQMPSFSNPAVSSQNFTLFSTSWHQGNNSTMTFSTPDYNMGQFNASVSETPSNLEHTPESSTHSSHCNSCCLPITITVNLDSSKVSSSDANTASTQSQQTIAEPHHELTQSFDSSQHHQLPQQQCVLFDNFSAPINPVQEKCRDAEIIRHLIMNTVTKNPSPFLSETPGLPPFDSINQPIQNCHFEQRAQDSFIPPGEVASNNLLCSVSESNSQFGPASFHQRISLSENLSQETCHETFSNLNSSEPLMYNSNPSYETQRIENCSFDINSSSTSQATFITSANSVYDSSQNPVFIDSQNSTNSNFIMPSSLSDIHTPFDTETTSTKEQMSLHPSHIQPGGKLTQSSEFTSNMEQNELFFHQSSTSESHPSNLHLYDMNNLHDSSHEMGYPLSGMENHENQLQSHQECLQSSHCSDIQAGLMSNQCDIQGNNKQLQDHPFDFSMQQNHQFSRESVNQTGSDASVVTFSDHQTNNLGGYINEPFSNHFYTNSASSNIPMFSQQCPVGSEAPLMESNNLTLNCSQIPAFKNAASDIEMEYHYRPQDNATTVGEKQLVLPSASFSPPSVADPAVTPDPGAMEMYNGSFQSLSAYDTYLRGGQSESRAQLGEPCPESGKFCVECNIMYKNQCKFHPCDCNDISDTPILSHARLTLPPCLKLGPSEVAGHTNKTGVFAKESIAVRTKFGPLIGSPVSCDQLGSTRSFSLWQTFVGSNVKVIDTSDENSSNWLMFVKPACVSSEQNLVAFQHGNRVYFVTKADVKEGQELRYWFSKDYARMLGISSKPKNAQHQLCPHCPVCKQVFADRKQVRSHIRIQHPKPQVNKCSHCSKRFSQVSHLNAHVLAVHMNIKKFVCNTCNKRFGDSSNLRKHIKSHSDERNFKCQICSKAFRQKAHLQVHMNSHMPVKHEQCRFCGNRFTRAFERKQHELQHTKQNRIECQHCGKVFYKQKIFKEHMKIHTNERNFPCSHCGKAFRNKFALTRHGPTCKQRKRGLSLVAANPTTNNILSRHLGISSSSHTSPISCSSTTDFAKSTADEDLSMASSVSSSSLSNDV